MSNEAQPHDRDFFAVNEVDVYRSTEALQVLQEVGHRMILTLRPELWAAWVYSLGGSAFYTARTKHGLHIWAPVTVDVADSYVHFTLSCDELPAPWVRVPESIDDPSLRFAFKAAVARNTTEGQPA